jgi:membrane complex biogenesis BtpA family protein
MAFIQPGAQALVGMIHLPPLPGSTAYQGQPFDQIVDVAVRDARALRDAGFRAGIIQNTHDLPFTATVPPETIAFLAAVGWQIRRELHFPLGVNVLKNDAAAALAVAAAIDAAFVRLKVYVGAMLGAEGVLEPAAPTALRVRQRLGSPTEIWADLFDRTSVPLVAQPLEQLAEWATKFGGAAVLIVTGADWSATLQMAQAARLGAPETPIAIGGGVTQANVREAFSCAEIAIVGSALEERPFTGPVSAEKARHLAAAASGATRGAGGYDAR